MTDQKLDRIPPTASSPVQVTIAPDLTNSGKVEKKTASGTSAAKGVYTLVGNSTESLVKTTQVTLVGTQQTTANQGKNAGKLTITANVGGQDAVKSAGFSVAAIPVNWVCTLVGPYIEDIMQFGMVVADSVSSDSSPTNPSNVNDLKGVVLVEEAVAVVSESGTLDGAGTGDLSDYFLINNNKLGQDIHHTPTEVVVGAGKQVLNQISLFWDPRTGAIDIPVPNSGFTITREITQYSPGKWQLTTSKVGANVSNGTMQRFTGAVNGVGSGAGTTTPTSTTCATQTTICITQH
jgi:hypothetical protein